MSAASNATCKMMGAAVVVVAAFAGGCRGETSKDPPIVPIRNMYDQPRYNMQEESAFFADKRTMRPLTEGVVAREQETDPRVVAGRLEDESGYVLTTPPEVIQRAGGMEKLVARGRDRFGIYCVPCHDSTGNGKGMVVLHGMLPPPSFHIDRIRHIPDGQLFATISNGIRNMPAYGPQIPVQDRWAVVSYVRALQLSQAPLASEKRP